MKEQIKELIQLVDKQPPTQATKSDDDCPSTIPRNSEWSDIPLTESENADIDTSWSTVTSRRRRKRTALKKTLNNAFRQDSRESSNRVKRHESNMSNKENNGIRTARYNSRESSDMEYQKPMQQRNHECFRRGNAYGRMTQHRHQKSWDLHHKNDRNDREHEYTMRSRQYANPKRRACFNCGLNNHTSNECHYKYPVTCRTCGEIGHKSRWHKDNYDLRYRN